MSSSVLLALLLIAAVAALALWLRRQSSETLPAPPQPDDDLAPELDSDDDVEWDFGESVAVTVDGLAFVGESHSVTLVPTPDPLAPAPKSMLPAEILRPGDFTAARVARGAAGVDPWRLELLGPDGEFLSYGFTGEDAARCAHDLVVGRGIVRSVADQEGRPIPVPTEQFEEARRRRDETLRLLALSQDPDSAEPLH
jgi:hypothetical protein